MRAAARLFAAFVFAGLAAGGLGPAPLQALTPYLVKDLNPITSPASSNPHDFVALGNAALFTADDGVNGPTLWRSDGSDAGTYPLLPGCGPYCATLSYFALTDHSYFFLRSTLTGLPLNSELWVTSGTAATTVALASIVPDVLAPRLEVAEQGLFYFLADGGGSAGEQLWRTDGTPAGTFAVTSFSSAAGVRLPGSMADLDGKLFFGANDGKGGALWQSDGTAAGTRPVVKLSSGGPYDAPAIVAVLAGRLIFVDVVGAPGFGLWRSDGTMRGTAPLTEDGHGPGPANFYSFQVAGNHLLFIAGNGQSQNLWATDGSRTRQLTFFTGAQPFGANVDFAFFPVVGSRSFFPVDDGVHGKELWTSDGTAAGTHLVADLCPGRCTSDPIPQWALGNRLLFSADDGVHGDELWSTDGTTAGTALIKDICRGDCGSYPFVIGAAGNWALFLTGTAKGGNPRLWRTNGTPGNAVRFDVLTAFSPFTGFQGTSIPGLLLFANEDPLHGVELWRSNGTRAGTRLVKDIATTDLGGSFPHELHAAGSKLFFLADDGTHGVQLWSSDGTDPGTMMVTDFAPPAGSSDGPFNSPLATAAVGETIFFFASLQALQPSLWRSDGTPGGTVRLTADGKSASELAAVGDQLFFAFDDGTSGPAIWKSDGTAAGTVAVAPTGPYGAARQLTAFQGQIFYFQRGASDHDQLWRSDGTAQGTAMVADLNASFDPAALLPFAGRLYFFARADANPNTAANLWSTDGTPTGTTQVTSFGLNPIDQVPQGLLAVAGNQLFIFGFTSSQGPGLWVSDGSGAGTRFVQAVSLEPTLGDQPMVPVDFNGRLVFPGPDASQVGYASLWISDGTPAGTAPLLDAAGKQLGMPQSLRLFDGRLLFTRPSTTSFSFDLWQSDGTPAGTRLVFPLGPSDSTAGVSPAGAGALLFTTAYDPVHGTELWAARADGGNP